MSKWMPLELSPEKLTETKKIGGVQVELLVSPYDVPGAMRLRSLSDPPRLAIEFKYIDADEPVDAMKEQDPHLTLFIGRNSGRLFKIEIDVDGLSSEDVSERVTKAIDRLIKKAKPDGFTDNYRLTRHAVHSSRKKLMAAGG